MNGLLNDVRSGLRLLAKTPVISLIAILTLAIGIGANVTVFSIFNAVLLRPLPYSSPDRLVMVWSTNAASGDQRGSASIADFDDWRAGTSAFEEMAATSGQGFTIAGDGEPLYVRGIKATSTLFDVLGVRPSLGRAFTPDEQEKKDQVAVISDGLWRRRFGADASIVGKVITLSDNPYTIIGVMPPGYQYPPLATKAPAEIIVPLASVKERVNRSVNVVGRLRSNASVSAAQAQMNTIASQLEQEYPDSNKGRGVHLVSLDEEVHGAVRPLFQILTGAVAFVLLIACTNVANILLARSSARSREIAIRMALGASRWRVVRQILTESLLLAGIGGAIGLLIAYKSANALVGMADLPRSDEIGIDASVVVFTTVTVVLTGILFGLAPALQASRTSLNDSLKTTASGVVGAIRWNKVRNYLIVTEVALSFVLLVGAGLMLETVRQFLSVDTGMSTKNVGTMLLSLSQVKYKKYEQQAAFFTALLESLRGLPGIRSAAVVNALPLSGANESRTFSLPGDGREFPPVGFEVVSDSYFETLGIKHLEGRLFDTRDRADGALVAVISDAAAKKFWPSESALGKRILLANDDGPREIVGVVVDVAQRDLSGAREPSIYVPFVQYPVDSMYLVYKTDDNPLTHVNTVRSAAWSVDKDLPVRDVSTMSQMVSESTGSRPFILTLLAVFALIALVLAASGIYGVMLFSVNQRMRELGLRVALGAPPGHGVRLVLGNGLALVLAGEVLGVVLALVLGRVLTSYLFGVSATHATTYLAVGMLLALVAAAACYIPARRAARLDPVAVLKSV